MIIALFTQMITIYSNCSNKVPTIVNFYGYFHQNIFILYAALLVYRYAFYGDLIIYFSMNSFCLLYCYTGGAADHNIVAF